MKRFVLFLTLACVVAALTGCEKQRVQQAVEEVETPQFSAKKGLLIPETTRQTLGLRTVEVTERKMPAMFTATLMVYQTQSNRALTSATLTGADAKAFQVGQVIEVRSDDGQQRSGRVSGLHTDLEKSTGMTDAVVEVADAPANWNVNTFLQGKVTLESKDSVPAIPQTALLQCSDGYSVYTVSGEHLVRTSVKIGAITDEFAEIKDGLYAGDQVVLQPVMSLWLTELAAVKGGQACCIEPKKSK